MYFWQKLKMMRKLSVVFFICFLVLGFAQSVSLYNPANNVPYPSEQYFCSGEQFNLKVDAVATSTGDYAITKDFASSFPLGAGSTPITFPATGSNKFSYSFPIGFSFSFYGKTYSRVVAGSNGRLVFTNDPQLESLKDLNTYTDRTFSGIAGYNTLSVLASTDYNKVFKNNPNQELNLAQIFFGYTDLVPKSVNSGVTYLYKNVSVGGVNALLVSFQNMIRTNGTGSISSTSYESYILLLQDGRIIINVNNKSENSYRAILGIQNDDATKFKVPTHSSAGSDYNNGFWKSEGVAWIFTPNQNLTPRFKWYQNATLLGESSNTLSNFSPSDNDILKVEVNYLDSSGNQVGSTVTDSVTFKMLSKPPVTLTQPSCSTAVLTTPSIPGIQYEWFQAGNTTVLSTINTLTASANGNYFVRIKSPNSSCFVDSDPVPVSVGGNFPNFNNAPKYICKTDGATTTSVNLYDYYPANPANYTVTFQENGVNVPDPTNFPINANTTRTVGIIANSVTTSSCSFTTTFDIVFASLPQNNSELIANKLCFGADNYILNDFQNQFFSGKNYQYSYSLDGGSTFQNLTSVNPQTNNPILVKIKHPDFSCETVVKLKFDFHPKILINPITPFPAHCYSSTEYFDLNITKAELEYAPNIKATFFKDAAFSDQITNLNYRGSGTVYIKIENTDTGCFVATTINLTIYPKPALIKSSPEIKFPKACGTTIYDLTSQVSDYIGVWAGYSEIRYFDGNGNQLTNAAQWQNYNSQISGTNPYMILVYNQTNNLECSDKINFDLKLLVKPAATISQILICSELSYSLQNFKDKVIANSSNYTFTDLSGNPLPANFDLSVLPLTVNFLMKDNGNGCLSDPQSVRFIQGGASVLLSTETNYSLCDDDFDGKTSFNLDSKKSDFTTDPTAIFEYFKDAGLTQTITSTYSNEVAFNQTVYARITLPGFCPVVVKIHLIVNTPSKSSTILPKYFICYGETLTIDAGTENVKWEWSTGENSQTIQITKAGNYSVKLTNANGCFYTHDFIVSDENQPKIEVINQTNDSIEVIANGGEKPYQYWFNGLSQSSNILLNPTASSYVIQVESATGCFGEPKTIYFIKINNAFTPNSDGINDYWTIENLDKMDNISLMITDRYGNKVFESQNKNSLVWDGSHHGRSLPTSTYWYSVTWFDPVTQKNEQRQGWILLKNRN